MIARTFETKNYGQMVVLIDANDDGEEGLKYHFNTPIGFVGVFVALKEGVDIEDALKKVSQVNINKLESSIVDQIGADE